MGDTKVSPGVVYGGWGEGDIRSVHGIYGLQRRVEKDDGRRLDDIVKEHVATTYLSGIVAAYET